MGTPGPRPSITLEDTLDVFERLDRPYTPLTAPEVGAELGCTRRTAHRKLTRLETRGDLETKKVGAHGRVWWRPVDANAVSASGADGAVDADRAVSAAEDTAQLRRRERELGRYRAIVETVEDGIYTVDSAGRFTMVNEAYAEMTGYPREELIGSHVSLVVDDRVVDSARELERELKAGTREWTIVADIRRADGGTVPAEATFALLSDDDEPERIGVVRDVTDRRAYERALEESERRYRTLVENFPDGVVALFDEQLRYTAGGGELLEELGVDPEDALGSSIWERYSADLASETEPYFRGALAGETASFEVEYRGRHLRAHTLPVRDAEDEIHAGMLVVQDITERIGYRNELEETVEKLEQSNDRLEQFASVVSHDLRNPLTVAQGRLALAGEECESEHFEEIEHSHERMFAMIDDLLTLAREGQTVSEFAPVPLGDVVEMSWESVGTADASLVEMTESTVLADLGRLQQLLENLIRNAVKHGGEGVTVRIGELDDGFYVEDDGSGIPADERGSVFESGFSTAADGTGFGLSIVRQIAEAHGWRVSVTEGASGGARFEIVGVERAE